MICIGISFLQCESIFRTPWPPGDAAPRYLKVSALLITSWTNCGPSYPILVPVCEDLTAAGRSSLQCESIFRQTSRWARVPEIFYGVSLELIINCGFELRSVVTDPAGRIMGSIGDLY